MNSKQPNKPSGSKPRSFRFSDEAEKIISQQEDPKKFIESLITGNHVRPLEVVPVEQLVELLEDMLSKQIPALATPPQPQFTNTNVGSVPFYTRTKTDVLLDIEREKQNLQDLLEVNQDPKDHAIKQQFIQELWNEYHALVKEEQEKQNAEKA